ncbi:MAG: tetratricopeptide repeat protein [Myxococcota bacterium]
MTRDDLELGDREPAAAVPHARASEQDTETPSVDPLQTETGEGKRGRAPWRRAVVRVDVIGGDKGGEEGGEADTAVHIGRYRVLHSLGRGGMGTVFAAHDETLDRSVALKLLHEDLGHEARQRVRLLREAQAMARVSHPNVVTVYEADVHEDQLFIAMELVDGITLDRWQRERPRTWKECLDVYVQAGRGLAAAHAEQLVHRDFKPGNCIIDHRGRVRVLDFGLARDSAAGPVPAETVAVSQGSALAHSITRTGAMLGTVAYMSPEQLRGLSADARSDQFSFCVSLHEALFGRRPFMAQTAGELLSAIVARQEARIGHPSVRVPVALRRVLRRGLRLDRQERYASMKELLDALESIPRRRRRWVLATVGIVASGTVGAGVVQVLPSSPSPCAALEGRAPAGWDAGRRGEVQRAILGTQMQDAPAVWTGLSSHLDAYAQEWSALQLAACKAAHVEQRTAAAVYEAQQICLGDRARILGALTERLSQADRMIAARAVSAAETLPAVSECQQAAVYIDYGPPSVPPQLREERDALLDRIARTAVLERLGRFEDGLRDAEEVVVAARAFAERFEPPLLQALYVQGRLLRRSRRFEPAEEVLLEALPLAEGNRDDRGAIDVLHELMLLSLERDRLDEGGVWFHQARAKLARVGNDPMRIRLMKLDQSKMALARDELERAATLLEEVGELCRAEDNSSTCRPGQMATLALVRERQGLSGEAQALYTQALAEHRRHGDLQGAGEVVYNLAGLYYQRGELREAVATYREALALLSMFHDADSPVVALAHYGLSIALSRRGARSEALEHAQRAEQSFRKGGSTDDRLWALLSVANLLARQERPNEALDAFQRAEALIRDADGIDDMSRATVLVGIGDTLLLLERLDEADSRLTAAMELAEKAVGARQPVLAYPLFSLGKLRMAQGRLREARDTLDKAWTLQVDLEDGELRANVAQWLARVLWQTDEPQRARELWAIARKTLVEQERMDDVARLDAALVECGKKCQ